MPTFQINAIPRPARPQRPVTDHRRSLPNLPARRPQQMPHIYAAPVVTDRSSGPAHAQFRSPSTDRAGRGLTDIRLGLRRNGTSGLNPAPVSGQKAPASVLSADWGFSALGMTLLVAGFWAMIAAGAVLGG